MKNLDLKNLDQADSMLASKLRIGDQLFSLATDIVVATIETVTYRPKSKDYLYDVRQVHSGVKVPMTFHSLKRLYDVRIPPNRCFPVAPSVPTATIQSAQPVQLAHPDILLSPTATHPSLTENPPSRPGPTGDQSVRHPADIPGD